MNITSTFAASTNNSFRRKLHGCTAWEHPECNPAIEKIKVFVVDKDFKEISFIKEMLCQYHVSAHIAKVVGTSRVRMSCV
jgi:hypothetical protein